MDEKNVTVLVTGASGFIGSHIVERLLIQGYMVRGSVRSVEDKEKIGHLVALEHADKKLQLFESNLLEEGTFDEACAGLVFMTA